MKLLNVLVWSTVAILSNGSAWGVSIGLFAAPSCESCNLTIPLGETRTIYIAASSGPLEWVGAEFRVSGLPEGWETVSTPVSDAGVALGDPFGTRANIAFDTSRSGACTRLCSVAITATTAVTEVILRIAAGDPPSNPEYNHPFLVPENLPYHPVYPAAAGELFINSTRECTVGVDQRTWSQVKQLFD